MTPKFTPAKRGRKAMIGGMPHVAGGFQNHVKVRNPVGGTRDVREAADRFFTKRGKAPLASSDKGGWKRY